MATTISVDESKLIRHELKELGRKVERMIEKKEKELGISVIIVIDEQIQKHPFLQKEGAKRIGFGAVKELRR